MVNNNYRYLVIGMFFMLLLVGSFVGCKYIIKSTGTDEIREEAVSVVNNEDDEQKQVKIYEEEENDVYVVYEDFYSLCSETIREEEIYYSTNVTKVKENELKKQESENKEYSIVEESNERLVFKRTIESNCPNHFNVKLEDKEVIVYRKISDKELEIYRKIDIPTELIREELKERLKGGIDANSKEELNLIIEDLES